MKRSLTSQRLVEPSGRFHMVLLLAVLTLPLLACGPAALLNHPVSERPSGVAIPIAFGDLPPGAACRIAAEFGLTINGKLYSWGGSQPDRDPIDPRTGRYYPRTGPDSFDCSGFTLVAYQRAGLTIGWVATDQLATGVATPCSPKHLNGPATTCWAAGDLLFWMQPNGRASHVAMYIRDGIFAECLNWQDGCRVWERPPHSIPAAYATRRIVPDCARPLVVGGAS